MNDIEKRLEVLFDLNKYDDVLKLAFENLYNSSSDTELIYNYIITSNINLQQYKEALKYSNEALGNYPDLSIFYYLRTQVYLHLSSYKDALQNIEKALNIEPNSSKYLATYAKVLLSQNNLIKAKEQIEKALELDSIEVAYHLILAMILYMLDGEKVALDIVNDVLKKEPHNIEALDMKQRFFTPKMKEKKSILNNLLFLNPFDKDSQKDILFIKYYYRFVPVLMAVVLGLAYLLQSNRREFELLEYIVPVSFFVLATIGSNDWRFNIPFIAGIISLDAYFNVGSRGIDFGELFYIAFMSIIFQFVFVGVFVLYRLLKIGFLTRLEQQKNNNKNQLIYFLFVYPFDSYEVVDTKAMKKYYTVVPILAITSLILFYIYNYHFQDIYFKVSLILLFLYIATISAKNLLVTIVYIFFTLTIMHEFSCDDCFMRLFTSIFISLFFLTIYKLTRKG